MPSSLEPLPASVTAWEPGELGATAGPDSPRPGLAVFEIASGAAVPDDLLAAARAGARAEGWSAGWAEGMRAAAARADAEAARLQAETDALLARHRAELSRAIAAVDTAAAALERQSLPTVDELEGLLLDSAFALAEALVGHALRDDATRAPAALARVLALAPVGEPVTVRLHPADHARLSAGDRPDGRSITLVPDPALAPGDAVATSGAREIDARIRAGVQRVQKVLAP